MTKIEQQALARMGSLRRRYKRDFMGPDELFHMIEQSIQEERGLPFIRIGHAMSKLLARNAEALERAAPFLGIPYPPTEQFYKDLEDSVVKCSIIGVSHCPFSSRRIKDFMKRKKWEPSIVTDAYINDELYYKGYLHQLMRNHRVGLIGRNAAKAAALLKDEGIQIAFTVHLNHYDELNHIFDKIQASAGQCDLFLIGASDPGRILCVKIAEKLNTTAVDIGHMLDALVKPFHPNRTLNRESIKNQWINNHTKSHKDVEP